MCIDGGYIMADYISDLKRLTRVIRPASPFFGPGNSNMADHQINGYQACIDRAISDAQVNRAEARAARRRAIKDSALAQRRLEEAEGKRPPASYRWPGASNDKPETHSASQKPRPSKSSSTPATLHGTPAIQRHFQTTNGL